ncbi:MAG: 3D-(3,5/4)-trihydroxycyclohexane-1,2-dione acylhydrolase (decyclizing) [Rhodospirillales bacterium]|nr:3D-(3,5/4)-trihydroxycyclohexane-1,2-dione acylhydrolase (decyclizing) [Rhodospirillales bacterium]
MTTIRLTAAQALVRAMAAQRTVLDGKEVPIFAGVWAIFGHGNVAGMGEALHGVRDVLPTWRAHNEQAMAHAAIAYAKTLARRRMMACTTSIGPGATNLVTAAAVAHVNRLPLLLIPGDVFASRRPDPVLQQIEDFADATVSANDCLRPVSRWFDRITRPEQIIPAFARAMAVLTDPAVCGPVTLAFCQDVQTEAYDYPDHFFAPRLWTPRRPQPDRTELADAAAALRQAARPFVVVGGGVRYAEAEREVADFCAARNLPMGETQAGKSAVPEDAPLHLGALGVTGTAAANALAGEADLVLAIGTRLADFTTASRSLFGGARLIALNVQSFDAAKHGALPLVADARAGIAALDQALGDWRAPQAWAAQAQQEKRQWREAAAQYTAPGDGALPADAQVIGAVQRQARPSDIVVCAAGGLPGELHKHWQAAQSGGYHLEYGYSCMGYEIAGGLGVKLAAPAREVFVLVGDGSYLMMNSEIATSVMLGLKLVIVVLDNRGFGCIDRLQRATGGAGFNNLLADAAHVVLPAIDFAAHAASLGATAEHVNAIAALDAALVRARAARGTYVVTIDTDPRVATDAGGYWWDVAVPEISTRPGMEAVRTRYEAARRDQAIG